MSDIYFLETALLLHGDGADGSAVFTDVTGKTVTAYGNAKISTAQSKFGGSSMYFDGSGDYLTVPGAGFAFGTGDFTIETWVMPSLSHDGGILNGASSGTNGIMLRTYNGKVQAFYGGGYGSVMTAAGSLPANAWAHIAVVRLSGAVTVYINGASAGTASWSGIDVNSTLLSIGAYGGATFNGYIDDLRITVGVGRYSAAFAPPTEAFSNAGPTTLFITAPSPVVVAGDLPISGNISIAGPTPLLRAYAGSFVSIAAPNPIVRAAAGTYLTISAPSPTVTSTAHDSTGENAAHITAPSPQLTFFTGAVVKAKAPSPTLTATGTVTGWAKAAVSAPSPIVIATATVSGMASAAIRAPSPNLVGYGGAVCSVTLTGRPTVQATATMGAVASIAITCPLFQVTASATAQNHGSINVIAPSPRMGSTMQAWITAPSARMTAIGRAVVTATYEAYAINLNHVPVRGVDPVDEVTRYTNFPFTHVVRYKNSYYGANSTGLYLLEGTTDDGAPIPWAFETAMTDFKTPNKKMLASAYFSGRFGPASTISLIEGEKAPNTYSFSTPRGTLAQNHRQKFGKGTKGRYYALSASGTGTCELDGIEPEVHQLTRRI